MKKVLFIASFLSLFFVDLKAQQYELKVYNYDFYSYRQNRLCGNNNKVFIDAIHNYGKRRVYEGPSSIEEKKRRYTYRYRRPELLTERFSKKIKKIKFYSFIHERAWLACNGKKAEIDIGDNIPENGCRKGRIAGRDDHGQAELRISFDYHVKPLISLPQSYNTIIGYEDPFTVRVDNKSKGFSSSVYTWEYQTVISGPPQENGWKNMPSSTRGKTSFTIRPNQFLSTSEINKTIYFRIKSCDGIYSNSIFYDLRKSAPHITKVVPVNTSCYDSKDGQITLFFDRALLSGERLSISLKNQSNGSKSHNIEKFDSRNAITFTDLGEGDYEISLIGLFGDRENTYTGAGTGHKQKFTIDKPSPVQFTTSSINAWCNGGEDGEIALSAKGGAGNYQYAFREKGSQEENWNSFSSTNTHVLKNLAPKNYEIKVRDGNQCVAKEIKRNPQGGIIGLGEEIVKEIAIAEPVAPVSVEFVDYKEPLAYGFSDGLIKAKVSGGTPFNDNTYRFKWKNASGQELKTTQTEVVGNDYFIELTNIGAGDYFLTVKDKNHDSAANEEGCTVVKAKYTLNEPPPLVVDIKLRHEISCNHNNEYSSQEDFNGDDIIDEFQDGVLVAHAKGGVPLERFDNRGLPYYYTWKKKDENGNWITLSQTDSIAVNLNVGEYSVNIRDKNGIVLGNYINNALVEATGSIYDLPEPEQLQMKFEMTPVACAMGSDGGIVLSASGGVGNYQYAFREKWSYTEDWQSFSSGTTHQFLNLKAGTYEIKARDGNQCVAKIDSQSGEVELDEGIIKEIRVTEPSAPVSVEFIDYKEPSAFGFSDGFIKVKVSGGTPFDGNTYRYEWKNSSDQALTTTQTEVVGNDYFIELTDIGLGDYFLTVKDKNHDLAANKEGCTVANAKYTLSEPTPLEVGIELRHEISCNHNNEYSSQEDFNGDGIIDEFQDGSLIVHAKGGVQLKGLEKLNNGGLPYYYTWKKKDENGNWITLSQTDSIAISLNVGEYSVNIRDKNGIVLGNYINNALVEATDSIYDLPEPEQLQMKFEMTPVACAMGSDGGIVLSASGGVGNYQYAFREKWSYTEDWQSFSSGTTHQFLNLKAGTYEIKARDGNQCVAKIDSQSGEVELDEGIIKEIRVTEPSAPVSVEFIDYKEPSAFGFSDGFIKVKVSGGTPFDGNTYRYEWKNSSDQALTTTQTEVVGNDYFIELTDIGLGDYFLTVKDKNHDLAANKEGCTVANAKYTLSEPTPLEVGIELRHEISCNHNNEYSSQEDFNGDGIIDEFQDGSLIVHAKGGVQLKGLEKLNNGGLPYYYTWKKKDENGNWITLSQTDSIAISLNVGEYSVNIRDKNGIVLGNYVNNALVEATDKIYDLPEPEQLQMKFETNIVTCAVGSDGKIKAMITGGVKDYAYQWNTGNTTQIIRNISSGTYFLFAKDVKGCQVQGTTVVKSPGSFELAIAQKNPTCYEGNDGKISVSASGGVAPYRYNWSTNDTVASLENLTKGVYFLTVTDANNCIEIRRIELEDPDPIVVDLGKDRTLCKGQSLDLDASISDSGATYYWESENGFSSTSPKVSLTEPGTYKVRVSNFLGCFGTDEITMGVDKEDIDALFLTSSQSFINENIEIANVSNPIGETTEWQIPKQAEVVSQTDNYLILRFAKKGTYKVSMTSHQGQCFQSITKKLLIEEAVDLTPIGSAPSPFIKEFVAYSNPNNGNFKIKVTLEEPAQISVRIYSLSNYIMHDQRIEKGKKEYELIYSNFPASSGVYFIVLETHKDRSISKMIIQR